MSALVSMLRLRAATLWLWQALFVLAVIWGFVSTHLAEQLALQRMRFVTMDSRDTFYLSSVGSFETAKQIHAELARMAAQAMFGRNPEGFDSPECVERLFNPTTARQLQAEASRDADVFRAQRIHEKFESGVIRELAVDDNTVLVSVDGQILRTATFNDRLVNESKKVTVFLRLTLNEDMAHNGRYPLVVTNYQERFE
jgi:sulfur carrier protein ThiS